MTKPIKKRIRNAVDLMDRWYGGDSEWDQMVQEEELKARVGQVIYELRIGANLTQTQLAEMVRTTQPVISKLENGDYAGSSLDMLWRICFVLRKPMTISCSPSPAEQPCDIAIASV